MTNEPENVNGNVAGAEDAQAKPKKKKPIMIFRPQNSRTGAVKAGQRPGTPARKERPERPERPAGAEGRPRRPAGAAGEGIITKRKSGASVCN